VSAVQFTPFITDGATIPLRISEADWAAFDALPAGVTGETTVVTDVDSDMNYVVRRAECGLGCACAAQIVFTP
jgi:hypothetical protein